MQKSFTLFSKNSPTSLDTQHLFYSSRFLDSSGHIGQLEHTALLRNFTIGKRNQIMHYNCLEIQTSLLKANHAFQYTLDQQGKIWWISTHPEQAMLIRAAAKLTNQRAITKKWTSGSLTNQYFSTLGQRSHDIGTKYIPRTKIPSTLDSTQDFLSHIGNSSTLKLEKQFPDLMIILDAGNHSQIIHEANLCSIPVISVADTNTSSTLLDKITYLIPGNPRSISFIYLVFIYLLTSSKNNII